MINKIKSNFKISGTKIIIPFKSTCSIVNKPFKGTIKIEYSPRKYFLEYVSFEEFVKKITQKKWIVEELVNEIFQRLKKEIKPNYLKVTVKVEKSAAHRPTEVWVETKREE